MSTDLLFESRSFFWPIVIWPHHERSHTIQLIGWRRHKPHTLKNAKMSFAGTVRMTNDELCIRHLFLGRIMSIRIRKDDIAGIGICGEDTDLIEVAFRKARTGRFMQFLLKGAPTGRLLLNLGGSRGEFMEKAERWHPTNKAP